MYYFDQNPVLWHIFIVHMHYPRQHVPETFSLQLCGFIIYSLYVLKNIWTEIIELVLQQDEIKIGLTMTWSRHKQTQQYFN
jgi:hypothetical protein